MQTNQGEPMRLPEVPKHMRIKRLRILIYGLTGIRRDPEYTRFRIVCHREFFRAIKSSIACLSRLANQSRDVPSICTNCIPFHEAADPFTVTFEITNATAPWNPTPEIFSRSAMYDHGAPLSACGYPQDMPIFFTQQVHSFSDFCIDENNQYTKYGNGKNSDTPAQVHARCNERLLTDIHTDSRCVEYDPTPLLENGIYRFYPAISRASPQGARIP